MKVHDSALFKRLKRETLIIVLVVERVWEELGLPEPTITSANDKEHMEGSRHYTDDALDFRTWDITPELQPRADGLLRRWLGARYDVVWESDHLHIEFDPKPV